MKESHIGKRVVRSLSMWLFDFRKNLSREEMFCMFGKSEIHQHAEKSAGNDFPNPYGNHEIRDGTFKLISVGKDKGNDKGIGENGWQCCRPFLGVCAKKIGSYSP